MCIQHLQRNVTISGPCKKKKNVFPYLFIYLFLRIWGRGISNIVVTFSSDVHKGIQPRPYFQTCSLEAKLNKTPTVSHLWSRSSQIWSTQKKKKFLTYYIQTNDIINKVKAHLE